MTSFLFSRRTVLRGSVAGALLLGIGGIVPGRPTSAQPAAWLTVEDRGMLTALADVILNGSLPVQAERRTEALAHTVAGVERAILRQPAHIAAELRDLFDLLEIAPARLLLCGFWSDWPEAAREDIESCLTGWRESRIEMLRLAYLSLQELIASSYFSQSESWALIGYDGPPEVDRPERAAG